MEVVNAADKLASFNVGLDSYEVLVANPLMHLLKLVDGNVSNDLLVRRTVEATLTVSHLLPAVVVLANGPLGRLHVLSEVMRLLRQDFEANRVLQI